MNRADVVTAWWVYAKDHRFYSIIAQINKSCARLLPARPLREYAKISDGARAHYDRIARRESITARRILDYCDEERPMYRIEAEKKGSTWHIQLYNLHTEDFIQEWKDGQVEFMIRRGVFKEGEHLKLSVITYAYKNKLH